MPTRRSVLAALSTGLAGCSLGGAGETGTPPSPTPPAGTEYWYTHVRATANPALAAGADLRGVDPVVFEPDGQPQWLVPHPASAGSHWTVVAADGRAALWRVHDGSATRVDGYDPLGPGAPPVVATGDGDPRLVRPAGMADRAAPAVAPGPDGPVLLYVSGDGDLVVAGRERTRFDVDGLPDGRLAALGDGRYALFTGGTDRYRHGALGDSTEGETLAVVDPAEPAVDWTRTVGPPAVFEGLQPLVADLDGDGEPEVVTTVADSGDGARIAVFGTDGERLATGPVHSPGWRHQLAVAPFGPDGRPELAVVRKPHVDRALEFYRLDSGSLDIVATLDGFSTHTYGSRILTGALAADIDADGRTELLVPTADRGTLVAVRRTAEGARAVAEWRLDGTVQSNVTGLALADGLAVGVAAGGAVSVWQG